MTDEQHPAQFDWATELSDAQGHATLSEQEAHEIGARLRSIGEKLKTYEDLGDAGSDVQLLRMGYAAARLEIASLQARIKTMAEEHADELAVAHLDGRMCAAQPIDAMLGEQAELRRLSDCRPELNLSNYGHDDVDELNWWAIEVSQCIDRALAAQPAGAQQPGSAYADLMQEASDWICEHVQNETTGAMMWAIRLQSAAQKLRASHGQAPAQAALAPAGDMAKLRGQRMVLCSLLGECLPVIDALMQMPGDDDSDARLNGLASRIMGALEAIAEAQVKGGES